jgi:hypothetical protein
MDILPGKKKKTNPSRLAHNMIYYSATSNIKSEDGQVFIARESQQVPKW